MPLRLLSFVLLLILSSGCANLSPWRPNSAANPYNSIHSGSGYQLAFVEFREQGSYWDPTQVINATNLIRKTPKPFVITYVHGWHNDAGSASGITRFSALLQRIARAPRIQEQGIHVIGVYLGWRGEITRIPVVNQLTFYNRKAAAERLAGNFDFYDAIAAISEAARESHRVDGSFTILFGHSFGGLIVERAVAHAINAAMHGRAGVENTLPADLVLMVNEASDSALSRQLINAFYARKTENTRPLLVSLTSSGDQATGVAFPIATRLASMLNIFGWFASSPTNFATTGHDPLLINHVTEKLPSTIRSPSSLPALETNLSHNVAGDIFTLDAPNNTLEIWRIRRVGNMDVPYWNVKVAPEIIRGHVDLWNERAEAMMVGIFRMVNPMFNRTAKPSSNLQRASDSD